MKYPFISKHLHIPWVRNSRSAFIWNMIGSGCNATMTFVLMLCITRFCDVEACGIFSIGFAIAQLMWTIGMFEEGTYQVTDATGKFTFPQYTAFKIISCALMMIISPIYIIYMHLSLYKGFIAFLLCLFKMTDAASNLYFSLFQQHSRLDISGFSMTVRVVLSMVVIALTLWFTGSLSLAITIAIIISVLWIMLFEINYSKRLAPIKPDFNKSAMRSIFIECLPLFISTFIINYIYNIPKYSIEMFFDDTSQAYFNYVYSVAFVMNLFSLFALKPMQTKLTEYWNSYEDDKFKSTVLKISIIMGVASCVLAIFFAFFGPQILGLFYGVDLSIFNLSFFLVLLGGGVSAIVNVFYNALTVMRLQKFLVFGYVVSAFVSSLASKYVVSIWGVLGACWMFIISMFLILVTFILIFFIGFKRKNLISNFISHIFKNFSDK